METLRKTKEMRQVIRNVSIFHKFLEVIRIDVLEAVFKVAAQDQHEIFEMSSELLLFLSFLCLLLPLKVLLPLLHVVV